MQFNKITKIFFEPWPTYSEVYKKILKMKKKLEMFWEKR